MTAVLVYSKTYCSFCSKLKGLLRQLRIPFRVEVSFTVTVAFFFRAFSKLVFRQTASFSGQDRIFVSLPGSHLFTVHREGRGGGGYGDEKW